MSFLKALLDGNEREVQKLRKVVAEINALEPSFEKLSDEDLPKKTAEFKERLQPFVDRLDEAKAKVSEAKDPGPRAIAQQGVKDAYAALEAELVKLVPEAFALVREAAKRVLGMRHYDVQLIAGQVLNGGRVAELATGEGKTLAATCPLYLNALVGKGSHLVVPNDYLAKRDAVWNGPVYLKLGLTVGIIQGASERYPYGSAYIFEPGLVDPDPHWNNLRLVPREECYMADIVYGTNAEFGFDYLRDNMANTPGSRVQRDLHFAIVDEMDSILIDEARTPLIISGMPEESGDLYEAVNQVVSRLQKDRDFTVEEKQKTAMPTDEGIRRIEEGLGVTNLADDVRLMHHVNAALKACFAYRRDFDYVVTNEGKVVIVDEFTGRLMHGRRYSDGLHQAIEAKEGVRVEEETQTVATITIQNYFRIYHKLAGMTGTAKTEEAEIRKIYGMDVVVVPTNLPMIRKDQSDVIYKTEEQKFRALVAEILQKHVHGQPTLVGTRSIEVSERLSDRLAIGERLQLQAMILILRDRLLTKEATKSVSKEDQERFHALLNTPLKDLHLPRLKPINKALGVPEDALDPDNVASLKRILNLNDNDEVLLNALENGIPHAVLNAKQHEREAEIIAEAGRKHAVTIATNMAGRGVDIMLGGTPNPDEPQVRTEVMLASGIKKTYPNKAAAEVATLGGLAILGSERHESRRIDRQLRGRSGRQGDPGESRFYLSLEDELWRLFGDRGKGFLGSWPEYEPLEARILTAAIERAQRKVEEHNFGIRKHTLEYDDVMNVHREVIYRQRREILEGADLRETILDHVYQMIEKAVDTHCGAEIDSAEWDRHGLYDELDLLFDLSLDVRPAELDGKSREELVEFLLQVAERRYEAQERTFAEADFDIREAERQITLQVIDRKWVEHLNAMDYLREGVWMRGFEQKDPLVIYKKEAFEMFNALLESIQDDMVNWMFHLRIQRQAPPPPPRRVVSPISEPRSAEDGEEAPRTVGAPVSTGVNGPRPSVASTNSGAARKVGRNDPCPCGSGKKYKFCHLKAGVEP